MANNDKTPASTPAAPAPSEHLVTIDANTLATTIAQAVAAAMAQNTPQQSGADIAKAITDGMAANTRRKVSFGEYEAKRKAGRPILRRKLWQNGIEVNPNPLLPEEINLLNRLTHSGRYFDRLVEVIVSEDDVFLRWNNKTNDQKMELKNHFRSLIEMLTHVVKEQEAADKEAKEMAEFQLAEKQLRQAAKERHFGRSKNTLDAIEKAGQ